MKVYSCAYPLSHLSLLMLSGLRVVRFLQAASHLMIPRRRPSSSSVKRYKRKLLEPYCIGWAVSDRQQKHKDHMSN